MAKSRQRTESASQNESPIAGPVSPDAPADNGGAIDPHDRIAMRAYELYLQRGAADGGDFDDWLAAERELASGPPRSTQSE
jgi:hypothetical protein